MLPLFFRAIITHLQFPMGLYIPASSAQYLFALVHFLEKENRSCHSAASASDVLSSRDERDSSLEV